MVVATERPFTIAQSEAPLPRWNRPATARAACLRSDRTRTNCRIADAVKAIATYARAALNGGQGIGGRHFRVRGVKGGVESRQIAAAAAPVQQPPEFPPDWPDCARAQAARRPRSRPSTSGVTRQVLVREAPPCTTRCAAPVSTAPAAPRPRPAPAPARRDARPCRSPMRLRPAFATSAAPSNTFSFSEDEPGIHNQEHQSIAFPRPSAPAPPAARWQSGESPAGQCQRNAARPASWPKG